MFIFLTIWLSISCINLWPVWVCCNGISNFTWPSRDLWAAINFPLRLLHTIYMNILPANLHIIIVNCVGPSLLQHAYPPHPFAAPSSLSLSFSLCVAFNQLLTLMSLARRSTRLFSLLSLAFYLRAPPSPLYVCSGCLSDSVSHSQWQSACLSGWDFPLLSVSSASALFALRQG